MSFAYKEDGNWVEIVSAFTLKGKGVQKVLAPNQEPDQPPKYIDAPDDMQCPINWPELQSPGVRENFGVFEVLEGEVPTGEYVRILGSHLEDDAGRPRRVYDVQDFEMAECKELKLQQLQWSYEAAFGQGFPVTIQGHAETLQMRDKDQVNWLIFKDTCNEGLAVGADAVTVPQPIRCTSNAEYDVTFAEGAQIMRDMKVWGGTMMRQLWAKKDAIENAANRDALNAVDLTFNV